MTELTLILGSKVSFPGAVSGSWEMKHDKGRDGKDWLLEPGRTTLRVPEKVADGLIALAKKWAAHNARRDVKGDLRRMVKVEGIKRDVEPDPEPKFTVIGLEALKMFADQLADRLTENMQRTPVASSDPKKGGGSGKSGGSTKSS